VVNYGLDLRRKPIPMVVVASIEPTTKLSLELHNKSWWLEFYLGNRIIGSAMNSRGIAFGLGKC
jgi:hypothetical protein